jgi:hypothetical protein
MAAAYQAFGDVSFLNPTIYASIHRATGTLFDANVTGVLAAMWIGGWLAIGQLATDRRVWWAAGPAACLAWMAVWGTASRTAFAAALIVTVFAVFALILPRVRTAVVVALAAVMLAAAAAGTVFLVRSTAVEGPIARLRDMAVAASGDPQALLRTLWERDNYGLAANRMIARHAGFGVGIGAFYDLAPEFGGSLAADNAQNWFRHQLAEFGIVGSLGWIAFIGAFAWTLLRPHKHAPAVIWTLRAMLIAFVLVSLVGMPGQDPAVAITVATCGAWFVALAGMPVARQRAGWPMWLLVAAVVAASVIGTAQLAAGRLRVPVRIQYSAGEDYTDYAYGFWWTEADALGEFRWAKKSATIVVPAKGRIVNVTAGVPADMAATPVHARVWVNRRLVIDTRLTSDAPLATERVPLPAQPRRVLIETESDHAVQMPPPDSRELALQVRWRFE